MKIVFVIAIIAGILTALAAIVRLTELALSAEKPAGRHALGSQRDPAAEPQGEADPFADPDAGTDPDKAADEYVAELRGSEEQEPETALILTAPVAETAPLEPLPLSPLDRREMSVMPARAAAGMPAPHWNPGTDIDLAAVLGKVRKWTPRPAVPQEPAPEPSPEPAAIPDWLTTSGVNAFLPVLELGDVGKYVDRVFAPAERAVSAVVAEVLGGEEKGDFAGVSLAGLPDDGWDLSAPVAQMLPGPRATGTESAA